MMTSEAGCQIQIAAGLEGLQARFLLEMGQSESLCALWQPFSTLAPRFLSLEERSLEDHKDGETAMAAWLVKRFAFWP